MSGKANLAVSISIRIMSHQVCYTAGESETLLVCGYKYRPFPTFYHPIDFDNIHSLTDQYYNLQTFNMSWARRSQSDRKIRRYPQDTSAHYPFLDFSIANTTSAFPTSLSDDSKSAPGLSPFQLYHSSVLPYFSIDSGHTVTPVIYDQSWQTTMNTRVPLLPLNMAITFLSSLPWKTIPFGQLRCRKG